MAVVDHVLISHPRLLPLKADRSSMQHACMVIIFCRTAFLSRSLRCHQYKQHHNAPSTHRQARSSSNVAFDSGWNPVHSSHWPKGKLTGIRCEEKLMRCPVADCHLLLSKSVYYWLHQGSMCIPGCQAGQYCIPGNRSGRARGDWYFPR